MADTTVTYDRLEKRLEDRVAPWLECHPFLGQFVVRERDAAGLISDETAPPKPVIILVARDMGRYHKLLPIRNLKLSFRVRANSKLPAGDAESFSSMVGTLEAFLDQTNLMAAWSGPLIAVMLATRPDGESARWNGLVIEQTVTVEIKAVAAELTVQGTGVPVG